METTEDWRKKGDDDKMRLLRIAKYIGIAIVAWILFFSTVYTIGPGERGILTTFGKPSTTTLDSGLHVKIPFVQGVTVMSVRTEKYEAEASAASKDLQIVSAKIATNYHLLPETVPRVFTELGVDYSVKIIQPMEQEAVKAITAKYTAEELITRREDAREEIKSLLRTRLAERGIIVEEVSITDFDFSDSFNDAIEQKVTAEQLKLKAERDLERIQVEAEQAKATAIGRRDAAIADAEGQAEAIRLIDETLRKSPQYVDYLKVQKWDGHLPQVTGGAIPLVQIQ